MSVLSPSGPGGSPASSIITVTASCALCVCLVILCTVAYAGTPEPGNPAAPAHVAAPGAANSVLPASASTMSSRPRVGEHLGELPLGFELNRGQTDSRANFLARGSGYTLFLTHQEVVLSLLRGKSAVSSGTHPDSALDPVFGLKPDFSALSVVRMKLLGSNPESSVSGLDPLPGVVNYFHGQDPKSWQTHVPRYAKVKYESVYPGINVVYYGNQGELEYDFAVAPRASVSAIHLGFEGVRKVRVDQATGDLVLRAGEEEVRFHRPVAYQAAKDNAGARHFVEARYVYEGKNRVGFRVPFYDPNQTLVIDPVLSYSTYLGGKSNDYASSIAVDAAGNAYVTGYTLSANFPVLDALQPTCSGGCLTADAFVTKLNSTGTGLIYSTYIGGSANDYGNGIALDSSGDVYLVGQTFSRDFPVTLGAFQTKCGGGSCISGDAFVLELNSSGSKLLYSTYLGGSSSSLGNGITLDSAGDAYVVGYTESTDFPVTSGVFQPTCKCASSPDLFVAQLNSTGSGLVYATYLGGSSADVGYSIALDSSDNAYVTGYTQSTDFPATSGAFQTKLNAQQGAFVSKLNSTATALVYSTYLGGSTTATTPCEACGTIVTVDSIGSAFVCGLTAESNFPTTKGAYQTKFMSSSLGHDAFITKLNSTGSALDFSTYLGGTGDDGATGMKLDSSGNVWVKGNTKSTDFPVTAAAIQANNAGDFDAYVAELNSAGSQLLYSTYLGGSGTEFGGATGMLALGNQSPPNVYLITYTNSTNFPVTAGAFQTANAGLNDGTVSLIVGSPNVSLAPSSLTFTTQIVGTTSQPQSVTVTNVGNNDLLVSSITLGGANGGDYAQTNNCSDVPAQGTCTVSVTFTPTTSGTRTATGSITDNAPASPQTISLTGTGQPTGPYVAFSPTSLTFATQLVGTTSAPLTMTLTNIGNQTLDITSISASGDFAATNNCGATVAVNASCTISVTFTPTKTFSRTGTLSVSDNASGSPQTAALTGTGTIIEFTPASLDFGTVTVGTTSPQKTITVTNTGTVTISVTGVSLSGTNHFDFSQTNNCGGSIVVGASCTVIVKFTPSHSGVRTASVKVKDTGAGGSPQYVNLSGTGQ